MHLKNTHAQNLRNHEYSTRKGAKLRPLKTVIEEIHRNFYQTSLTSTPLARDTPVQSRSVAPYPRLPDEPPAPKPPSLLNAHGDERIPLEALLDVRPPERVPLASLPKGPRVQRFDATEVMLPMRTRGVGVATAAAGDSGASTGEGGKGKGREDTKPDVVLTHDDPEAAVRGATSTAANGNANGDAKANGSADGKTNGATGNVADANQLFWDPNPPLYTPALRPDERDDGSETLAFLRPVLEVLGRAAKGRARLTRGEKTMVCNLRPRTAAEIDYIVEEAEERLGGQEGIDALAEELDGLWTRFGWKGPTEVDGEGDGS